MCPYIVVHSYEKHIVEITIKRAFQNIYYINLTSKREKSGFQQNEQLYSQDVVINNEVFEEMTNNATSILGKSLLLASRLNQVVWSGPRGTVSQE